MQLIDTHAHLTYEGLIERADEVLANARAAGVEQIITIGTNTADARAAIALAGTQEMVSAAAGMHPHDAAACDEQAVAAVAEWAGAGKVVAIGELGLDYHYDFADRETQHRALAAQLEMAAGFDLPLIVHCREAFPDMVAMLERYGFAGRRVVVHCFTGTADEARELAEHGWRISFTGIVTFKNSKELQAIAKAYPADQLMVETDSPYLSPMPIRHVRPNEPAHVAHTLRFLAELRGEDAEALGRQTTANARAFFGLAG